MSFEPLSTFMTARAARAEQGEPMSDAQQLPPLPDDWQALDGALSYNDAIAALRALYADGWRPPEGSPFREREAAK